MINQDEILLEVFLNYLVSDTDYRFKLSTPKNNFTNTLKLDIIIA